MEKEKERRKESEGREHANGNTSVHVQRKRNPRVDLRNYYTIFWQTGMVLALLIIIVVTKVRISPPEEKAFVMQDQEEVLMEEIIQTRQEPKVPPPPRPQTPVAVPNDEIIEDIDIVLDAELDFGEDSYLPPPPQPKDEDPDEDFFVVVEQMPELVGGISAIQGRIRYPEMARIAGIEGRVFVQFIVNERGEVEDPVVVRGIGGGCDEEALRVVKDAKFQPGLQRGRPVRVQYSLPIVFVLNSE